jgi:3-isopropylmalate dehydratase small subunit
MPNWAVTALNTTGPFSDEKQLMGRESCKWNSWDNIMRALRLTIASVADRGFGSGSSREDAVRALQGAGIMAVIAPTFAFICEYQ